MKFRNFSAKSGSSLAFSANSRSRADLGRLARRIGGRQIVGRLILAHRLGAFETLRQQMDQRGVDIVDAVAQAQQFGMGHG